MSIRVDTASLIPGAIVCGNRGLGVLGSSVPSTGDAGAGYLHNDLSLPADASKEVRGLIETPPASGTLYAYEDSSFTLTGAADGAYDFVYRLFVDGVDLGTATASITVGDAAVSGVAAWTEASDTAAIIAALEVSGAANWTEASDSAALVANVGNTISANANWTESGDTCTALATIRVDASIGWAEAADTASMSAAVAVNVEVSLSWTEAEDVVAMVGGSAIIYASAPSGSGYSTQRTFTQARPASGSQSRPAAIQRNRR